MADVATTALAEWTGRGTRVGEVLRQLDGLRRRGQRSLGARTSVVTLVVRAPSAVDAWDAIATVHRFGGHHPARSIVVVADAAAPPRLDARVALTGAEAAGHQVWFEDVVLSVAGPVARRLGSLIEPFTLADLPVAVWYLGMRPDPADDLLAAADAVLVDSKVAIGEEGGDAGPDAAEGSLPEQAALDDVAALFDRVPVVDLAWIRLRPWRELLAAQVDADRCRAALGHVTSVEVRGKAGARALLGGWLASRLDLRPGALQLVDARHASMAITCEPPGGTARFAVERVPGERLVRATTHLGGGPSSEDILALPQADLAWSLGEALGGLRRDRTYEAAVRAAAAL